MNPCILADNRWQEGTLNADSTESSEFSVTNLSDGRSYTYWKAASAGSITVSVLSAEGTVNALGIVGHNFGTAAASVFFDYESTGGVMVEKVSMHPTTDRAILVTLSDVTASHYRLRILTASVAPQMSYVASGIRIDMPQPVEAPTIPYIKSSVSETPIGKTGHPLGTVLRYRGIKIGHKFSLLDRTWVTSIFEEFWDNYHSQNIPFFYGWDLVLYPSLVFYCWRPDDTVFSWPTSMLAYVDSIMLEAQAVYEP